MDGEGKHKQLQPANPGEENGADQVLMDLARHDAALTRQELQLLA